MIIDGKRNLVVPDRQRQVPNDALVAMMLGGGVICEKVEPDFTRQVRQPLPFPRLPFFHGRVILRSGRNFDGFPAYHF